MNKIAKRLVAGASAAALLVSAVGIDQLADLFTKTSYAEYSSKTAKSTGFNNLEQDTDKDSNYNTGYGLHTNKTATEVGSDGRTFDVNLESWYVGENPVDVATILDASGSMAWTVDTLEPLELDATSLGIDVDQLKRDYSIDDLTAYTDYKDELTKVLAAIQDKNKGYLPQEIVDKILIPDENHTDNTKLSYAGYKYYVYENRSSVSEFVPLGYWDGGKTAEKFSPIGYYPFENSLENKVNGDFATVINNTTDGTPFDEAAIIETAAPDFRDDSNANKHGKVLYLNDSVNNGAVFLNVSKDSLLGTDNNFSLLFQANGDTKGTGNTDIIYIGNLNDTANGIRIFYDEAGNLKIQYNATVVDTGSDFKNGWQTFKFVFEDSTVKFTVGASNLNEIISDFTLDLSAINAADFGIIVGGLIDGGKYEGINDLEIDNVYLFNKALSDDDVTTLEGKTTGFGLSKSSDIIDKNLDNFGGKIVGLYSFDSNALKDSSNSNADGKYIKQSSSTGFDKSSTPDTSEATAEYSSDGKSLSINNLGKKNRAVLLDAKPSGDYTVSFQVQVTNTNSTSGVGNIMYVGKNDTSAYYTWFRKSNNSRNQLNLNEKNGNSAKRFHDKVFNDSNWRTITFVVENGVLKFYLDGEVYSDTYTLQSNYGTDALSIILAGLWNTDYNRDDLFVKNVYVFDKALDADQVAAVAKATAGQTQFAKVPSALTTGCEGYHATMKDTDVDIAQISERLAQNPNDDERRGWYYVNSHSKWEDIEGCLASGKQYIGIYDKDKDNGIDNVDDAGRDIATVPSGADSVLKTAIQNGNTDDGKANPKKFNKAPENERSIRFYVDSQNHLRCFAWSGSTSKDTDIRTFCSLVYEKQDDQITKYEELNNALNTFYQKIAEKSDLSNNAVVRFSTNSAIGDNETATNTNLKKLIMKDWTNWSDYYQTDMKAHEGTEGYEPKTTDYLQNLLIGNEKSSTDTTKSSHGIDEYPYVMTGGTYTWTGLKAFYDNMVKNEDSQTAKDIANDARDKYLIIFTDGRDNTQDYDVSDKTATDTTTNLAGSPKYTTSGTFGGTKYVGTYNPYADDPTHMVGFSIKNYDNNWDSSGPDPDNQVQKFVTGDHEIKYDGDLAEAWADKLKDEGYTIYCVMMASGSISPTANEAEYNKAKNFLKSLSGSNELDAEIEQRQNAINYGNKPDGIAREQQAIEALRDEYVIVVDPTVKDSITVTDAFQQILEQIQLPRNDYTVQDYIDPRFDLIGKAYVNGDTKPQEVIYHLGANGEVTFTDTNNKRLEEIQVEVPNSTTKVTLKSRTKVGNIIDDITNTRIISLPYTPMESYMVNRKADSSYDDGYDTGNIGTGYIYYDDVKDMYYLRWTDQIIPMENEAFDTDKDHRNLDVWSATIRLKAKDDFIGGNNILTNGNEAGENLVYSDATIENMTDNPELYGLTAGFTYRQKLAVLSGTDRKINAVDAGGVSQAVYGNGIDIPSSGFPRTTVNVRLLKLDAKNLNDVIYMGEVVSPTMMLADLEDGYMTGSYYLQYLERYAYRVYGDKADSMPLIELLNKWLKIDDKNQEKKTFTIPYIYLPDPEYNADGTLAKEDGKVKLQNSTGASWDGNDIDFADLNLCDVTGFITYTWKRDDDNHEDQQLMDDGSGRYDITKDYVVKNTKQIKYNLQLTFTPLKETKGGLAGFELDKNFIKADPTTSTGGDKFFNIVSGEFAEMTTDGKWTTDYGRADYLQAMIQEKRTYEPHVMYDENATDGGKWVLVDDSATAEKHTTADALKQYKGDDAQISTDTAAKTVTDKGVYDWDSTYKKAPGNAQLENGKDNSIKGFYTDTPNNVNLLDVSGNPITDTTGKVTGTAPVSLAANTTYTKDVVNAALALELFVDGKYLKGTDNIITVGTEYKFIATRDYKDPYNKPSYATEKIGADASDQKYKLTFKVTDIPAVTNDNEIYKVWATLTNVAVLDEDNNKYISINTDPTTDTESIKSYLGYENADALPIGSYYIEVSALNTGNNLQTESFQIGTDDGGNPVYFKYLKVDNDHKSYTYNRFPKSVYEESDTAADITKDGEYLIWNEDTSKDNSKKNIADNKRVKDSTTDTQTVTFYFGTVAEKTVSEDITLTNTKGVSVKEYLKENPDDPTLAEFKNDYAKDRLGIIMLSADNNSLAISKKVDNTDKSVDKNRSWKFTVTVKPESGDATTEFNDQNTTGFKLKWYKDDALKTVAEMNEMGAYTSAEPNYPEKIKFVESGGIYTATIYLKHDEKVVIDGLPEGTWQVVEDPDVFCTPHNDQSEFGEDEWLYNRAESTLNDIELAPASQVNYVNEFPYELPSTGGSGTVRYLLIGTALISVGAMLFAVLFFDRRKKARK